MLLCFAKKLVSFTVECTNLISFRQFFVFYQKLKQISAIKYIVIAYQLFFYAKVHFLLTAAGNETVHSAKTYSINELEA